MQTYYFEEGAQTSCSGFFNTSSWVSDNYAINENYQRIAAGIWGAEFVVSTIIGFAAGDPSTTTGRVGILFGSWAGWGVLSVVESHLFHNQAVKQVHSQSIKNIQTQEKPDQFAVEALLNDGYPHAFFLRDEGKGIEKLINRRDQVLLNKTTDQGHRILDVVSGFYRQENNIKALVAAGAEFGSEKFKNLLLAVERGQLGMVDELLLDEYTEEQKLQLAEKCLSIEMFEFLEEKVGEDIDPFNEEKKRLQELEKENHQRKELVEANFARRKLLV